MEFGKRRIRKMELTNYYTQIRYSNGHIWNAHYHTHCEALLQAADYSKAWGLTFEAKRKQVGEQGYLFLTNI